MGYWLKAYSREHRRYPVLHHAPADPCDVLAIWPKLCRHFHRYPTLKWNAAESGMSCGCPRDVTLNLHGLNWLLVCHEFGHAIGGRRHQRWHGPHHDAAVARVAAYVTKQGWHRGARRRRTKGGKGKRRRRR